MLAEIGSTGKARPDVALPPRFHHVHGIVAVVTRIGALTFVSLTCRAVREGGDVLGGIPRHGSDNGDYRAP